MERGLGICATIGKIDAPLAASATAAASVAILDGALSGVALGCDEQHRLCFELGAPLLEV